MAEKQGRSEKRRTGDEEDAETGGHPGEDLRSQGNLASPPERQTSETSVEVEVTQETIEVDKATYVTIQQLRAQLEQATQRNRIQQLQLQQLQQQANAANVEQTNEVEQSPASERLPQRSEPQLEPQTPLAVHPIQASHRRGPIPVQPHQIFEGSTVDDDGNWRAVHPQYDRKLVLPEDLRIPDYFEQAQTICDDLLRLSRNHPERLQELQSMQETFDSQQMTPQGLTEPEYEIVANLFGQLVSAYHHNPDRRQEISDLLANYQTNGPESLPDIPDCVDVSAPHFESFRNDLVNFSESHLTRMDRVVERVLQGLCATDRNLNIAPGCLSGLVQFDSTGGFGYFLASYSKGKLSKMLKSVIFDKSFFAKFVCPDMIGDKQMLEVDRRQAEQLLRFLLDRLLRVQVLLNHSDIKKCLSESKLEVPIQISVARLFIPKAEADGKAQQLFNESFQSNVDVKAAFLLASRGATTAILQPTGENIPDRNQTPSFSVMAKPLQMDEMRFDEALTTVALKSTQNGILKRFNPGDKVTVHGHPRVGVVVQVALQKEELVVALPSEVFWRGLPQDVRHSSEHSQLPVPGSIVSFTHGERLTEHGLVTGYGVLEDIPDCDKGKEKTCSIRAFSINSENVTETVEADYFHTKRIEGTSPSIWTQVKMIRSNPKHFRVGDYIAICRNADAEEMNDCLEAEVMDKRRIRVKVSEFGRVVKRLTIDEMVRIEVFRLPNVRIDISWHNVRRANRDKARESQKHYEKIYEDICLLGN